MSDPFKKPHQGDQVRLSVRAWSDLMDMVLWFKRSRLGNGGDGPEIASSETAIDVKNGTGSNLPRFSVVGISAPLISPEDNANIFSQQIAVTGVTPAAATHQGKYAILLEPIASNAVGRAVASGVVPCYLDTSTTGDYAEIADGVSTNLKTGIGGSARVLWVDTTAASPQPSGASATVYWGLVHVGARGPSCVLVKVTGNKTGGGYYNGTIYGGAMAANGTGQLALPAGLTAGQSVLVGNLDEQSNTGTHWIKANSYAEGYCAGLSTETPPRPIILIPRGQYVEGGNTLAGGTGETAQADTWARNRVTTGTDYGEGVKFTQIMREVYNPTGDQTLYGFTRDFIVAADGRLVSISAETRVTIDTPDPDCPPS